MFIQSTCRDPRCTFAQKIVQHRYPNPCRGTRHGETLNPWLRRNGKIYRYGTILSHPCDERSKLR